MRNTGEGAKPPLRYSLNLSAHFRVWVTVWVRQLTHILTHTFSAFLQQKASKTEVFDAFLERVDEKDAPYMSVAVYMLYGCFTLQRKPWRSGDLFASSISNEQQAPN